jgi:pimeloyl-ACP methyl ester carboxylesterase
VKKVFPLLIFICFTFSLVFCGVITPIVRASTGSILFSDNFDDGVLDGWNITSGNWYINSGHLVGSLSGAALLGRINLESNATWDNYAIELDVDNQSGVDEGIGFRVQDGQGYEFNLRHGTGDFDTPEVKLFKIENSGQNVIYSTHNVSLVNNKFYHLRIEANQETLTLYIDGTKVIEYTDSNTLVKKGSLSLATNTGGIDSDFVRFDNIVISTLGEVKTPLVFIPGIGGTQFKTRSPVDLSVNNGHGGTFTHIYPQGEQVWVNANEAAKPGEDDYFDVLKLKSDGQTPEADLELINDNFAGVYQETINFFNSNGYTLNKDFFMFPYDWRKDLSLTAPQLDQKINQILSQTGASKVDIVAHSMGGLVARNYISDSVKATKVRKLIELGVPHLGSVEYLKAIRYGLCLTDPRFAQLPYCLGVTDSELKDVIQNMPGGFELSPSQKYFSFYDGSDNQHPYPLKDDADLDKNQVTGNLNYDQIKTLLTNLGHNSSLFTPSESFHQIDNNLTNTNGVATTLISGSGTPTLGQIIEKREIILGINISKKDALRINGDDTVPLFSSSLFDPDKNTSLKGNAQIFYTMQNHSSLAGNGPALNLTTNILNDLTDLPSGIATQPYKLKGKQISVHSPVNIDVIDVNGNHTGISSDGSILQNIPGSSFETLDDAKFVWLPDDGNYDIKLNATDTGSFDFKIRDYQNDVNDQTTLYENIPLQTTTTAEVSLDTTTTTPPPILVDNDGNGTTDATVNPTFTVNGNENTDQVPPEAQVAFNPTTLKLDILGTDNLSNVQVTTPQTGTYSFTDAANNTTKLQTQLTNSSGTLNLILNNITYNLLPPTSFALNSFVVSFSLDRKTNKLSGLTQTITIKNQTTVKASYDSRRNETKIDVTDTGKRKGVTITKTGIILLKLNTKNGQLVVVY